MRRVTVAIPLLIVGVCLYFIAVFAKEGLSVFLSPIWGLDNESFSRTVYDIGRLFGLRSTGLVMLAAFLGALKLVTAIVFAIYLLGRFARPFGQEIEHELLDAAVVLALVSTFIAAAPALLEATPQFLAQHRPVLWLCGLAATLSMIERVAQSEERSRLLTAVAAQPACTQPPRRGTASALRWDYLRRLAGR
jgi:hypothetical protein